MDLSLMQIATMAVPTVGALAWLFRMEGRLNTHEAVHAALRESQERTETDVRYIRDRIDKAINGRG